jgi:hypothetical protein
MEKIMDRRQFLIRAGLTAGQLALPRFFDRALAFVENHGEPLLELPSNSERELIASYQEDGVYWIIDGLMPKEIPPVITWREYFQNLERWTETLPDLMESWEVASHQLDQPMNKWTWEDHWCRVLSPNGLAWDYLCELDLGPQFGKHQGAQGEIRFIDGPCPGNDSRWVEVDDLLSISLLQNRLNELGENTSLEINDSPF